MRSAQSGKRAERWSIICQASPVSVPAAAHHGGRAVAEQGIGDDLLDVARILVVQAAQLDAAQEHAGAGLSRGQRTGGAKAVERSVAAHEPDVRPRDVAAETQSFDQSHVDARRSKPVHETVTRCAIWSGCQPASSKAARDARSANARASAS